RSASLPRPMSGRAVRHGPPSPHLSSPFASFRVFRGPHSLGKAETLTGPRTDSEGQVKYCRCTFFGHATPDRAGARPYRVQYRVAQCDMGLPAHTSLPLSRLFACFAGPIP